MKVYCDKLNYWSAIVTHSCHYKVWQRISEKSSLNIYLEGATKNYKKDERFGLKSKHHAGGNQARAFHLPRTVTAVKHGGGSRANIYEQENTGSTGKELKHTGVSQGHLWRRAGVDLSDIYGGTWKCPLMNPIHFGAIAFGLLREYLILISAK